MSSSRIIQSSVWSLRVALAKPVHNASEHRLDDAQERPLGGVTIPACFHQLPALLIKHRKTLWTGPWRRARKPADQAELGEQRAQASIAETETIT